MKRDGATISIWQHKMPEYIPKNNLIGDQIYDVLIVGGGITGLATGLLLQQSGKKCLIAEAKNIGFGTTGGTTAHLNTVLDSSYAEIERNFGENAAALVCSSALQAIELVEKNIQDFSINCGYSKKNGYLFSVDEKQTDELEEIFYSSNRAGCAMEWSNVLPLDIRFKKAVVFKNQAQFHPLFYLKGLAEAAERNGAQFFTETHAKEIDATGIVTDEDFKISAKHIVVATNSPVAISKPLLRAKPSPPFIL